ncbi:MAG TPA: protein kinase [Kofleriaceae bacterium]
MPGPDLSGAVLDDRYQVIEPIAEGAMGAVYRGERLKLGRAVAIKIMHDALPDELASRGRFEREAKLMARLEHPHCVSVIDFGLHEGKPYLVMELVRGTSLLDVLAKSGRLEPQRAGELVKQVLSGLAHAHELGIVHRDIKPANIMLSERTGLGEQIRILDFGLARPAIDSTKLTTGIVVGTPNYMAPEQIKGGAIDGRTDLYAVGVMLFELITGKKPFLADDPLAVVRKHLNAAPPTLAEAAPGLNLPELEEVVAKALAKQPQHRFASAAEMSAAIDQALQRRASLADVMARSVPNRMGTAPSGPIVDSHSAPQVATASGWNVPEGSAPIAPPSGPVPGSGQLPMSGPGTTLPMASSGPVAMAHSGPVTGPTPAPGSASDAMANRLDGQAPTDLALDAVPREADIPPTRRRTVPPTRINPDVPSTRMLPIRGVAVTRKQLYLGGGALVLLIIIIVAATRGGGSTAQKPAPVAAGSAHPHPDASSTDPVAPALARASDLYANGDLEPALDVVTKARRAHPDSAQLAFLGGKIYFAKLWWTDGVKAFRDAIRLDPAYRSDPELVKIALRGFITTPDADPRIEELLRDLGDAAKPALEETAKSHPNAAIRARAAAELHRLP